MRELGGGAYKGERDRERLGASGRESGTAIERERGRGRGGVRERVGGEGGVRGSVGC